MPLTASFRRPFGLLYAGYAWLILLFFATPVATACLLLPGTGRRRAVARWGAGTALKLMGSRVTIRGHPLGAGDGAIVVANHQSYLDGIILTAVLPPQYTFLIKREMVRVPVAGFVLSRLGSEFVDRENVLKRQRTARRLVKAARQGRALAVFPEGTFRTAPGLKSFHMGAFRIARRAALPVAPVVITGARAKLPSGCWLPRPGPLVVEFCPRIAATDFSDEFALMRAVRAAVLARLAEPDLEADDLPATDLEGPGADMPGADRPGADGPDLAAAGRNGPAPELPGLVGPEPDARDVATGAAGAAEPMA